MFISFYYICVDVNLIKLFIILILLLFINILCTFNIIAINYSLNSIFIHII